MTGMQPEDDVSKGMQTIELAIIDGVLATGRHLTTADFKWHRVGSVLLRPGKTNLQVRIGHRTIVGVFGTKEIEDSADRVDRPETRRTMQRIIDEANRFTRYACSRRIMH
jgi:hypothetical protein